MHGNAGGRLPLLLAVGVLSLCSALTKEKPLVLVTAPVVHATTDRWSDYNSTGEDVSAVTQSVMERASSSMLFKVGVFIHKYWLALVLPVGFVGNCLAFVVLLQQHNRRVSCCLYMAALAVSDTGILASAAYYYIATVILDVNVYPMTHFDCQVMACLLQIFFFNGVVLILSMTIDRFVAIRWPLRAATFCTPRRAKITIATVILVSTVYNIPHTWMPRMVNSTTCAAFQTIGVFTIVYSWMNFATNCAIPFTTLLCLNGAIIQTFRGRSKYFENKDKENSSSSGSESGHSKSGSRSGSSKKGGSRQDSQLTAMLLLVTFAFLLLTLPQYTRYAVFTFVDYRKDPSVYALYILIYNISNKCYYTNSAVNFFLYCIGGSKFRQDLVNLCRLSSLRSQASSRRAASMDSLDTNTSY